MAGRGGLDDAAGAMVVARHIVLLAVRGDPRGMAVQRFAVMAGAQRDAILPQVARRVMAQRSLGDDARGVVPGRALDQLDVMLFLRGRLLGHVDLAAAEHCAARRRCHQLHHCRANRHCPVLSFLRPG